MKDKLVVLGIVALIAMVGILLTREGNLGAQGGIEGVVASSTIQTVTTTAGSQVATTSACVGRIITTTTKPIWMTFSDRTGQVPINSDVSVQSDNFGFFQATSTTVFYDASEYGCGHIKAISDVSTTITAGIVR